MEAESTADTASRHLAKTWVLDERALRLGHAGVQLELPLCCGG